MLNLRTALVPIFVCALCFSSASAVAASPDTTSATDVGDNAKASLHWPVLILKGGVGVPLLLNARAEVRPHPRWSAELGLSTGLLPPSLSLGARWRPALTTFGEGGPYLLSVGLGLETSAFIEERLGGGVEIDEGVAVVGPDLLFAFRPFQRLGLRLARAQVVAWPSTSRRASSRRCSCSSSWAWRSRSYQRCAFFTRARARPPRSSTRCRRGRRR